MFFLVTIPFAVIELYRKVLATEISLLLVVWRHFTNKSYENKADAGTFLKSQLSDGTHKTVSDFQVAHWLEW